MLPSGEGQDENGDTRGQPEHRQPRAPCSQRANTVHRRGARDWMCVSVSSERRHRGVAVFEFTVGGPAYGNNSGDRDGKDVPTPCHRPNGLLRIVMQHLANVSDAFRERFVGDDNIRPDGVQQLFAGDDAAGAFDEVAQDLK